MHGTFPPKPKRQVAIALIEWMGHFAVLERDKKSGARWTFPGGKVEEGESLTEAVVREAQEETGIYILPYKKLGINEVDNEIRHYYLAKALYGRLSIKEPHKFSDARWMTAQEIVDTIGDRLSPFVRAHLDRTLKPEFNKPRVS